MDRVPLRRHEPDRPEEIKGDKNTELNAMMELEDPEVTENFHGVDQNDGHVCAHLFQIFQVPDKPRMPNLPRACMSSETR